MLRVLHATVARVRLYGLRTRILDSVMSNIYARESVCYVSCITHPQDSVAWMNVVGKKLRAYWQARLYILYGGVRNFVTLRNDCEERAL